ncbi:PBP1A family penicillin-binding protein [Candidatus Nomurabacteria bacterium]|nr:PBP1A family penicillin-binding protein [Candidatus Nomurabacteria bacterium]
MMYRKGKYTQKLTPWQKVKRFSHERYRWWKNLSKKKKLLYTTGPILAFLIITPIFTYIYYYNDIGDIDRLMNRNNTGVVLLDRNGKEFFRTGRAGDRHRVPLNQISDHLEHALIAAEDKDFYKHDGFSVLSIFRAFYNNIIARGITGGGSTLTQQLAKNTLLSKNQTVLRKYQELTIAMAIEHRYSKDEILNMYLNSVYFGENSFGIEDAAETYFNKKPSQLSLSESAMLVGVLPAPSAYSPISGNQKYAKQRQETVLTRMVKNNYISEDQKKSALGQKLAYAPVKDAIDNAAPHYTEMILSQIYDKYGEETVTRSGYQVKTSLDLGLQRKANAAVSGNMNHIRANGGSNAGLIAIDPKTGGVRAMVGSYNYKDKKFGTVNMAITPRQPGSSFKPIYYEDALERGLITPATVFNDAPINDLGNFRPRNALGNYNGKVTVRQALAWSLNIPAVRVMQKEGVESAVKAANDLGINTIKKDSNYGLALALGAAEAPLHEMTSAYATFADGGMYRERQYIESIEDKYSKPIFVAQKDSHRATTQEGAYLISDILSDAGARSGMFGGALTVYGTDGLAKKVAVKTGTTDDSRDAWTIGYTPDMSIGVWVGNNDNSEMLSGGSDMAGPIWKQTMSEFIGNSNPEFSQPAGVVKRSVCTDIGTRTDVFLATNIPRECSNDKKKEEKKTEKPKENDKQDEEKCTVAGKESLLASDPNCKEEMCTLVGKENLAANDPNCREDEPVDTDGDGVPDDSDQCPNTEPGAAVDESGCGLDSTDPTEPPANPVEPVPPGQLRRQ